MQEKQSEWYDQWSLFSDDELFLFKDWIHPVTLDDFKDMEVLECGCGGGQHTSFIAPFAKHVTAVDLNTVEIARERNRPFNNITFVEDDIADMDLGRQFDIVFSIGVIHHTDDPDQAVENLRRHVRPGGRLVLWVYSSEGNFLAKNVVEPVRKMFFKNTDRKLLAAISRAITALMYVPIYTLYLLPLPFLPYYNYFKNFRKLSFERNTQNVFDKLNAPQVEFISHSRISKWFDPQTFDPVHISNYNNVSWRGSGTKR